MSGYFNSNLVFQLKESKMNRENLTSNQQRGTQDATEKDQLRSLTKMLLCVILVFIVCNCLSGLIIWALIWYRGWDPVDIEVFACIPLIINSSVNFLIYTLLGTKFRAELKNLFSGIKNKFCSFQERASPVSPNSLPMSPMTSSTWEVIHSWGQRWRRRPHFSCNVLSCDINGLAICWS